MSILIQMGNAVKRATQAVLSQHQQRKSGLWVPPDYVAGLHYGGFDGYEPWVQDCIRVSMHAVRGIGPDEMSEITTLVVYQDEPLELALAPLRHRDAVQKLESLCERLASSAASRGCAIGEGLSDKAREQIRRADGSRGPGCLLAIGLRHVVDEEKMVAELKLSVSCWAASTMEEALASPPRKYVLGG